MTPATNGLVRPSPRQAAIPFASPPARRTIVMIPNPPRVAKP